MRIGFRRPRVPVSAGQSRTFDNIPRGVFPGTFAAGGTLDIVAKDMELACQLARDVGGHPVVGGRDDEGREHAGETVVSDPPTRTRAPNGSDWPGRHEGPEGRPA